VRAVLALFVGRSVCFTLAQVAMSVAFPLQDIIGISVVHPTWAPTRPDVEGDVHRGWQFVDPAKVSTVTTAQQCGSFSTEDCVPDTVENCKFVRDLYDITGEPCWCTLPRDRL
jgi:hypothetical protein